GRHRRLKLLSPVLAVWLLSGCGREAPPQYVSSDKVKNMSPALFAGIRDAVNKESGTVAHPKMLGNPEFSATRLKEGQAIFVRRCEQCHGTSGDGAGPVAA